MIKPEVGERWRNSINGCEYEFDWRNRTGIHALENGGRLGKFWTWEQLEDWAANATKIGDAKMKQLNVYDITTFKRDAGLTDSFSVIAENFAHAATIADMHKKVGHSLQRIDVHRTCLGAIPSPVISAHVNESATA